MAGVFGVDAILGEKQSDEDDYFKILGCSETSSDEQISAEYRVRALQCHPDKHPGDDKALRQFQRLQEAKETLLDPEKRQKYDKWKRSEMCIPYKQWLGMSSRCATTMHWAKPRDQTMIESCSEQRRRKAEQNCELVDDQATTSDTGKREATAAASGRVQKESLVWKPSDSSTSIYSKFRNYKI